MATHADAVREAERAVARPFKRNKPLDEADVWARIIPTEGCWHWIGPTDSNPRGGYGRLMWRGARALAHRVVYELVRGAIPEGMTLDHLCRNRLCVNPDHLEPVTSVVNVMRGQSPQAQNARRTHCTHGHALEGYNVMLARDGHRACRECHRAKERRRPYRDRRKVQP